MFNRIVDKIIESPQAIMIVIGVLILFIAIAGGVDVAFISIKFTTTFQAIFVGLLGLSIIVAGIVWLINEQKQFSGARQSTSTTHSHGKSITGEELAEIVKDVTFDDGKVSVIEQMANDVRNLSGFELSIILKSFAFDQGKVAAIEALLHCMKLPLTGNELRAVLKEIVFDDQKALASTLLSRKR